MELEIFRSGHEVMGKRLANSLALGIALVGAAGVSVLAARSAIGRIGKERSRQPDTATTQAVADRPEDLIFEIIERRITVTQVRAIHK